MKQEPIKLQDDVVELRRALCEHSERVRKILGKDYAELDKRLTQIQAALVCAKARKDVKEVRALLFKRAEAQHALSDLLASHGFTEADLMAPPLCPDCNDTGRRKDGSLCDCARV